MPTSLSVDTLLEPVEAGRLVEEIEQFLAALARPQQASAHPLVSRSTAELVAEALRALPGPVEAPLAPPLKMLQFLPDWVLPAFKRRHGAAGRSVSVAEHLELTALVVERFGWARGRLRTRRGARCIVGAQAVLYRLGYGDERTVEAAAGHVQAVLAGRGLSMPYPDWNDHPDRTQCEVVCLLRQAAADARINDL